MNKHIEALGDKWHCLLDNPEVEIPAMAISVMQQGGTRDAWQRKTAAQETILMAFPPTDPVRGAVVIQGVPEGQMKAKTVFPLLEGLPNDITIDEVRPWKSGVEGEVSGRRNEEGEALWFYTPFLFRDSEDLTPGVRQTMLLAGLAMGVRRGLLDEMTIASGPSYEEHAAIWLHENPDKTRLDVPQLKIPLTGSRILTAGQFAGEYQLRAPITSVEVTSFGPQTVYMLHLQFGLDTENPLNLMVYAPQRACQKYEPHEGDEIDAYIWLQGRMLDF